MQSWPTPLVFRAPERPDVALRDLSFVRLGVDNPHAGRCDEDVIDVPPRAGYQPVVKCEHAVAELAFDKRGQPTLTVASLLPRGDRLLACADLFRHLGGMIAVAPSHVVDAPL
jgi:hypothetical protein